MLLYNQISVINRIHLKVVHWLCTSKGLCILESFSQKLFSFHYFCSGYHKRYCFELFFNHEIVEVLCWTNFMPRVCPRIISCCSFTSPSYWGKPSIKKIKSVDFFHTRGEGVNPKFTLLKKCGFYGEGLISTLFKVCALEFCPISSSIG